MWGFGSYYRIGEQRRSRGACAYAHSSGPSLLAYTKYFHLVWTSIWSGPPSGLVLYLVWTFTWSGSSSGLDLHLVWIFIWSWSSSGLDLHLVWSFIWSGPSSCLDLHLVLIFIWSGPSGLDLEIWPGTWSTYLHVCEQRMLWRVCAQTHQTHQSIRCSVMR